MSGLFRTLAIFITRWLQGKFAAQEICSPGNLEGPRGLRRKEARCMKRTFSGVAVGGKKCAGVSAARRGGGNLQGLSRRQEGGVCINL